MVFIYTIVNILGTLAPVVTLVSAFSIGEIFSRKTGVKNKNT
jgi:hypothetical protein